jgi:hypothetical protein
MPEGSAGIRNVPTMKSRDLTKLSDDESPTGQRETKDMVVRSNNRAGQGSRVRSNSKAM